MVWTKHYCVYYIGKVIIREESIESSENWWLINAGCDLFLSFTEPQKRSVCLEDAAFMKPQNKAYIIG